MESRPEMKARHEKELEELKIRQRREHQNLKIATLGMPYGMTEEKVMAHIAGNCVVAGDCHTSESLTVESMTKAFENLQAEFNKHKHPIGELGFFPPAYRTEQLNYEKSLKERGIDNDNKHYGTKTGRFSSSHIPNQSIPRGFVTYQGSPEAFDFGESPKCECGAHKVSGPNCSARMHSTWCPLHGDS